MTTSQTVAATIADRREWRTKRATSGAVNDDGSAHLRYHGTDVVTAKPDEGITVLRTGGWRTVTTKARMNQALAGTGYRVFQTNCDWHLYLWGEQVAAFADRELVIRD